MLLKIFWSTTVNFVILSYWVMGEMCNFTHLKLKCVKVKVIENFLKPLFLILYATSVDWAEIVFALVGNTLWLIIIITQTQAQTESQNTMSTIIANIYLYESFSPFLIGHFFFLFISLISFPLCLSSDTTQLNVFFSLLSSYSVYFLCSLCTAVRLFLFTVFISLSLLPPLSSFLISSKFFPSILYHMNPSVSFSVSSATSYTWFLSAYL